MDRSKDRRSFRYHDTSIVVSSADRASLDWLEGFLAPAFVVPNAIQELDGGARYEVNYTVDSRRFATLCGDIGDRSPGSLPCFALDGEIVCLPAVRCADRAMLLDEPHGCVLLVERGSIEIVADRAAPRRRLTLLRVVREIAAEGWRRHFGHLELHAAALAVGDAVLLLAGAKNAGKTTSLVHALDAQGARLVANDRVAIRVDGGGVAVRGMPTIVNIRSGTFARFSSLVRDVPAHPYPWSLNDREWRAARETGTFVGKPDYLRLSPARFAAQLGCDLVAGGRVAAILICSLDREVSTRSVASLPREEVPSSLAACLYGRDSRGGEATVIEQLVAGSARHDALPTLRALAAVVPVFECRLGRNAYDDPFDFDAVLERDARAANHEADLGVSLPALAERLGARVVDVRPLASSAQGATAHAHRARLSDGRVVKVRRLEEHEDAVSAARLIASLDDPAFARFLHLWGEMAVEEWIEGEPLADPPDDDALRQAGDLLGRLHARDNLDGIALHRMAATTRDLWRIEHDLAIIRRAGGLGADAARRLLAAAVESDPGEALFGLCHRDFCGENMVLDAAGRLRVVDNASIVVAALDYDLQRTAYRWGLGGDRWEVFLRAYRVHRAPDLNDGASLFWRLRAVTLSARFRLSRGASSAALPLAELRRIHGGLAGARGAS